MKHGFTVEIGKHSNALQMCKYFSTFFFSVVQAILSLSLMTYGLYCLLVLIDIFTISLQVPGRCLIIDTEYQNTRMYNLAIQQLE